MNDDCSSQLPKRSAPPIQRSSLPYKRQIASREKLAPKGWGWSALLRRILLIAAIGAQTYFAVVYILAVLPYQGRTFLEIALTIVFAMSFAWISLGAWLALIGFCLNLIGGDPKSLIRRTSASQYKNAKLAPTAILMPIYHEPVDECLAGLAAVYKSLERTGNIEHFEFFILSDSRDPKIWLAEQAGWGELVTSLNAQGKIHYRRRKVNLKYKSGNIADFLRRWGSKFRYFLILDADSLMEGKTLTRMVRIMQCHNHVGILQAPPKIINARTPFARIQQFANSLYAPLFATGLAAIQLGDGSYWGHNAMLRTHAFMNHCALANLRGVGLFKGAVLSHDFVEAAFIRRGGYEVWMEPKLGGSYEQSPPSLVDELARDRRWAKGNLQHIAMMLGDRGLALAHRMTFFNGVLSYAAAPLWLAFLALSLVEVAQFTLFKINYFPSPHQLVPLWPQWHPRWSARLIASTAVILFLPKILALLYALFSNSLRAQFGGGLRLFIGTLIETIASIFLAPVRMLAHSRFVIEALLNVKVRWAGQNRGGQLGWLGAFRMHCFDVAFGIVWSGFAWWLKPSFFYWSLPVTVPLIISPAISVFLSKNNLGNWLGKMKILATPQDKKRPDIATTYSRQRQNTDKCSANDPFIKTLLDPNWNKSAQICADKRKLPDELIKLALDEGLKALTDQEKTRLISNQGALAQLHKALQAPQPPQAWEDICPP